ncbi:benzodiazepine receptor binding [Branchiostoma belcheri]|nr:benzodiazepine receptor binding [Branchiostoma belcheri]
MIHSIEGLAHVPGTQQKIEVRSEKSSSSLWDFIESKTWKRKENTAASVQFETLPGGPPDPPVNVTVEPGQDPSQVLVSWLPVTIDTAGTSNGAVVQGYAVYSGHRKIAEVTEPTADSVVVEAATLAGTTIGPVLVRTVSSSGDSINSQSAVIPLSLKKMLYQSTEEDQSDWLKALVIAEEAPEKPAGRRDAGKIQSIEMMYEGRTDDSSPESDISDEQVEQFEPSVGRTVTKSPQDGLPMPPGGMDRELQEKKPEIRPSFRSEVHSDSSNHSELSDIAEEAEEDLEEEQNSDSMSIDVPGLDHAQPVHLTAKLTHPAGDDLGANTESDLEEPPLPSTKVKKGHRASPTQHWREQRRGHASPVPDTELPEEEDHSSGGELEITLKLPEEDDYSSGGESDVTLRDSMEGDSAAPRWFVALFDYDPMTMSPNPDAADEELPFREGQLIKACGDKDGNGLYMGFICILLVLQVYRDKDGNGFYMGFMCILCFRCLETRMEMGSTWGYGDKDRDGLYMGFTCILCYRCMETRMGMGSLWGMLTEGAGLYMGFIRMLLVFQVYGDKDGDGFFMGDGDGRCGVYMGFMCILFVLQVYGDKDGDGFFMGDVDGRCGVVPCNLVEEIEDDYRLQQLRNSHNALSPDKMDSLAGGYHRDEAHIQNGHLSQLQSPVRRMRALFDYDPQEMSPNVDTEMELPFFQGDIIDVGEMGGRRGLVPSNFLEDLPSDQADNYAPQPTGHDRSYRSPSHIQERDISPQPDRTQAQPPKKKKGLLSKGKKLFKKLGGSVEGKSKR